MRKKIFLVISLLFLCICAGCRDDNEKSTTEYTVKFYNQETLYYETTVVEGRRIEVEIVDPTNTDADLKFSGWYKDTECTSAWNFSTDTVTADLSLYAGWITTTPTNIKGNTVGLESGLTWLQAGVTSSTTVTVEIFAFVSSSVVNEETVDVYATTGTTIAGSISVSDTTVTWTPESEPAGGKYLVKLTSGAAEAVEVKGIWFKGEGTIANPYLICEELDLASITKTTGTVGANEYYKLAQNITYTTDYSATKDSSFAGNFDGNGFTIEVSGNSGIFYEIASQGIIDDLTITGAISTATWPGIGTIANKNNGTITNSIVYANVTSEVDAVAKPDQKEIAGAGGLVGINLSTGIISNCSFAGTTEGGSSTGVLKATNGGGGIVGTNYGKVTSCINKGCIGAYNAVESGKSLSAYSYCGGIAGYNYGTIEKSGTESIGKLLAQRALSSDTATEYNNIAIGGVAGYNGTTGTITLCYFEGIRCHGDQAVGGIVGINAGAISSSYAAGKYFSSTGIRSYIGGRTEVGGIAGRIESTSTITNCYVTANVFAYGSTAYAIAEKADNCVANKTNNDTNTANSISLSSTVQSNTLVAPTGTGNILVDNTPITDENANATLAETYVQTLGSDFAYSSSEATIRFAYALEALGNSYSIMFYNETTLVDTVAVFEVSDTAVKAPSTTKDGFTLLGYGLTSEGEVLIAANATILYSEFVDSIDENKTLALYAIFEEIDDTPEPTDSLVIGYLTGLSISEELAIGLKDGFATYCTSNSITAPTVTLVEISGSKLADYTALVVSNGTIDVLLGTGNNINTSDSSVIKDSVYEKVAMNITTNSGRYAISLTTSSNLFNASAFLDFIETEEAIAIMNPEPEEEGTHELVVGIFDKYCDSATATALKTAFETYLTTNELTVTVTFTTLTSTGVAAVVDEIIAANPAIDAVLGGGGNINTTTGTTSGTTLTATKTDVVIAGATRNIAVITDCVNAINAQTFVEFLATDAAKAILDPEPEGEGTDALVIGIFDKYCDSTTAAALKTAFETYLSTNNLTVTVTFTTLTSTTVGNVVDEIIAANPAIDAVLGGGNNITTTAGSTSAQTLTATKTEVVIGDSTRNIAVITGCANAINAQTFVDFLATDTAKNILSPTA